MVINYTGMYCMERNFGGCKLWLNGKNIIGGINFGGFMKKVLSKNI